MKISIYGGEAFPIYEIHKDGYTVIEVDKETLERWRQAFEAFSKVQEEIVDALGQQGASDKIWFGGTWDGYKL